MGVPDVFVRVSDEVGNGAVEGDAAVVEHGQVVAGLRDVLDDVRGEQDGALGGEVGQHVAEADAFLGVQAGGGLVDDEQLWVVDQRLCDADALAHPAGEGLDTLARGVGEADQIEQMGAAAPTPAGLVDAFEQGDPRREPQAPR